ncbi:MAG: SGNH/GDSL hydrolase family protein [Candidatus Omnitrophica bacterium]|nr:SGNH/GDSL hydrolase family protein [Candidatus Omnitrophota bacterium]
MKKNLVNLTALIAGAVVSLLIAEICFRTFCLLRYDRALKRVSHELFFVDKTKDYVLKMRPNTSRTNKTFGGSDQSWEYKINEYGFRGDPFDFNRKSFRIVFLGDSYTFGWAISDEDVHPRKVEEILQAERNKDVSVFNLGVPGYSTVTEAALLRDWIDDLKPDLVVLDYVMNDAELQNNVPEKPELIYRGQLFWLLDFFMEQLKTFSRETFGKKKNYSYLEGFEPKSWKWRASKEALRDISALCAERGIPLMVFILPDVTQRIGDFYGLRLIHEAVKQWGAELEVPTYDLLPYFDGKNHEDYWVPGDGHPNAKANQIFAEVMADKIMPFIRDSA